MKPARIVLAILLVLNLCVLTTLRAAESQTAPSENASKERFLVVVETSAAMQKRAENTQKALGSVISSGLKGTIQPGSTIGLWTFNDKLTTGQLPLQLWTQQTRQRVALALVQALQQQKNEKVGTLSEVWQAATNILAHSERITVLLFTSGSEPLAGTPYDLEIAETFTKNAEQQRKSNMPFVTILRAVQGKIVTYAVNMPPWPLEVPDWPAEYKPVPAQQPEPKIEQPIAVTTPHIVPRPDPAILSPTNTIYLVETSATPAEVAMVVPPIKTDSTNPVVRTATPPVPKPASSVVAVSQPKPVTEPDMHATPAAAEPAAPAKTNQPVITILIAGICVLLGVMVVFIALLRWSRRSAGESLITRSMHQRDR